MKALLKKMVKLLFVCVFIVYSVGQIEAGSDVSEPKRNEAFEFEPIIRQILDGYQSFYRLENFAISTFEFEADDVPYLGIDVSVDMTLTCHPKEMPYFKGMEMAMENGGLGITDRLEAQRQIEKRAKEIIEECYLVTDRSTFKYAIKKEDLNSKELSKLSAYYCRVDASAPILYRADSTNTPEDKKMEMFNSGYNMVLQKIKTVDVIRADVNYDRLAARDWARNNAFEPQEYPSETIKDGTDCANFVSKALNAGGIPEDHSGKWFRAATWGGWAGDNWFRTGHNGNGGVVPYMTGKGYFYHEADETKVNAGCIMYWLNPKKSHVALVTFGDSVTIKYTEHGARPSLDTVYIPANDNAAFYKFLE